MRLSISNIGWEAKEDDSVYELMRKNGFTGLEIAPTRIFAENPYEKLAEAKEWGKELSRQYGFVIPSMQSVWYGRKERLFASEEERRVLVDYTKEAVDFAEAVGCKNLVFGCPKNRCLPKGADPEAAIPFFREIGGYAAGKGIAVSMEANPAIYHTNYVNTTAEALELIERVDCKGFLLNLDVGTMVQNNEDVSKLRGKVSLIHHVHISEPGLKPIERRKLHPELAQLLADENYPGFISIEMGKAGDLAVIKEKLEYVRGVFG